MSLQPARLLVYGSFPAILEWGAILQKENKLDLMTLTRVKGRVVSINRDIHVLGLGDWVENGKKFGLDPYFVYH